MKKLILHIPHSSTRIPLLDGYLVNQNILDSEILKLTDWFTDDLFQSKNTTVVKAEFSRIFCDPERFADDEQEVMAKFGMGVLYEKTDDGKQLRVIHPKLRAKILNEFYWKHHQNLSDAVNNQLKQHNKAIILDCHSFPDIPFQRDLDKKPNRPDLDIGIDAFHTPNNWEDISKRFFEKRGFSVGINRPYSGTIVPLEHYNKTNNVHSIMLEVNRKLYLNENSNTKSARYPQIKKVISEYIEILKANL